MEKRCAIQAILRTLCPQFIHEKNGKVQPTRMHLRWAKLRKPNGVQGVTADGGNGEEKKKNMNMSRISTHGILRTPKRIEMNTIFPQFRYSSKTSKSAIQIVSVTHFYALYHWNSLNVCSVWKQTSLVMAPGRKKARDAEFAEYQAEQEKKYEEWQ